MSMRTIMRMSAVLLLVLPAAGMRQHAFAQETDARLGGKPVVTIMPLYQQWQIGDNETHSQWSASFSVFYPIAQGLGLSVNGLPAGTSGDATAISGYTDTRVGLSYYLQPYNLVLNVVANIPTGKTKLTEEEFYTTVLFSNAGFGFSAPTFGQGFNIQPTAIWAIPLSDDVVVGLGAGYHYRGGFTPIEGVETYDPGDEVLATAGIDFHTGEASTLSLDAVTAFYGADKLGEREVFQSGVKICASAQYKTAFGFDELRAFLSYRSYGVSDVVARTSLVAQDDNVEPDYGEGSVVYTKRLASAFALGFGLTGKFFTETESPYSGFKTIGAGLFPTITLSKSVMIPVRGMAHIGTAKGDKDLTAFEAGIGLRVEF